MVEIYVSIEGIALEHFSAAPQADINSSTPSRPRHAVFHSFLSDDSKQDAATTTAHRKRLISFLNNKLVLTTSLGKIWENTDGCAEQYRCASALYIISVMSQTYSIIIDRGISAPGHGKEVVDGLNAVDKRCIYINRCPRFNFLGQSDLIHRLKCTLALKIKM